VLARLIARIRERVATRLWQAIGRRLAPDHQATLATLLTIPENARMTVREQLRRGASGTSSVSMVRALKRVETIRAMGMRAMDVSAIPPARLDALARYAVLSSASTITRMPPDRRIATLFAFARAMESMAHDGVSTAREQKVALAKTVTKFLSCEKDQYRRNMIYVPHWSAKSRPPLSGHQRPLSQVSRQVAAYVRARFIRKKHAACLARSMVLPD
jgi:hypothetical protein